jgi:tyrosine decarboxylase / aspartate 1-decarboxylase
MSGADLDAEESAAQLRAAVERLAEGFAGLPSVDSRSVDSEEIRRILGDTASRLHDNFPYFHPLYAGQMLKPPHPLARLAYALSMWINPNNHALDGGRASSAMEREAVAALAAMFGWETHLGHLCGGGTMANLEALWVARELRPGAVVLASSQAHYTHSRISAVLGIPFEAVECDRLGRIGLDALAARLSRGGVGTIVATMGTTATGSVDPLPEILALSRRHGARVHADAAYGGYFTLAGNLAAPARRAFDAIGEADSIVIDPHKHGLQPYGCGCVLFRDPAVGRFYKHDSPYTYFSSAELHLGEISLECSRPGASAVALWATQRLLPLTRGGTFARGLEASRDAARALHSGLAADSRWTPAFEPELDIVVWAAREGSPAESSVRARRIFEEAAKRDLHLALAELPGRFFGLDAERVTCLRSVLMKPEHREWEPRIREILGEAREAAR